jgi:hypothetical protein
MQSHRLLLYAALAAAPALLAGCAVGKTYAEIDPEGAREEVRRHTGYYALKDVTPGTAKLVLRTTGPDVAVQYATSVANTPCEGLEKEGTVRDVGRGVLLPSLARLSFGSKEFIAKELQAPVNAQVQGRGSFSQSTPFFYSWGQCGPFTARFEALPDHAYLVNFRSTDRQCSLEVFDATDPDAPVPIPFENLAQCPKP